MAESEQLGGLSRGAHRSPDDGRCAMEWVAHLAGEPHGDRPACVSPLIRMYVIALNDTLDDHQRQRLAPYLRRCIGTAGDQRDGRRARRCLDWLARSATPAFLDLIASQRPTAQALRSLPTIAGNNTVATAINTLADPQLRRPPSPATDGPGRYSCEDARSASWERATQAVRAAVADAARGSRRAAARRAAHHAVENAVAAAAIAALDGEVSDAALRSVRLVTPAVDYVGVVGDAVDLAVVCEDAMARAACAAARAAASAPAHHAAIGAAAEHARSAAWDVVQAAAEPSSDSPRAWRTLWDTAADTARATARQAATDALQPTTRELQHQAVDLLDDLLPRPAVRAPARASRDRRRPFPMAPSPQGEAGHHPTAPQALEHRSFPRGRAQPERAVTPPMPERSTPC
jgi:hypothetical protein